MYLFSCGNIKSNATRTKIDPRDPHPSISRTPHAPLLSCVPSGLIGLKHTRENKGSSMSRTSNECEDCPAEHALTRVVDAIYLTTLSAFRYSYCPSEDITN
eukprot:1181901-Prorocentrum_minimum.AAC.3